MADRVLQQSQVVPRPVDEVFAFFADPRNLERITPPFLGFQILTEGEIPMAVGTLIDYRIRLHGVPMKWRTRIEEYVPKERFVDLQLQGPYRFWHHLHTFKAVAGGTQIDDRVTYRLPLGVLGDLAHGLFVRRQLEAIFSYRRAVIAEMFGAESEERSSAGAGQALSTSAIV